LPFVDGYHNTEEISIFLDCPCNNAGYNNCMQKFITKLLASSRTYQRAEARVLHETAHFVLPQEYHSRPDVKRAWQMTNDSYAQSSDARTADEHKKAMITHQRCALLHTRLHKDEPRGVDSRRAIENHQRLAKIHKDAIKDAPKKVTW
jgi:hypothetical protein